jgi:hypothetical protein
MLALTVERCGALAYVTQRDHAQRYICGLQRGRRRPYIPRVGAELATQRDT